MAKKKEKIVVQAPPKGSGLVTVATALTLIAMVGLAVVAALLPEKEGSKDAE